MKKVVLASVIAMVSGSAMANVVGNMPTVGTGHIEFSHVQQEVCGIAFTGANVVDFGLEKQESEVVGFQVFNNTQLGVNNPENKVAVMFDYTINDNLKDTLDAYKAAHGGKNPVRVQFSSSETNGFKDMQLSTLRTWSQNGDKRFTVDNASEVKLTARIDAKDFEIKKGLNKATVTVMTTCF